MKINFKKPTTPQIVIGGITLVLFIVVFISVSSLVSTWCVTRLPGMPVQDCAGTGQATPDPAAISTTPGATTVVADLPTDVPAIPEVDLPPTWDGASRVNILVMGVDSAISVDEGGNIVASADRSGPPRSDTMILLTVDPQTRTAGMISIPRDLWTNIPGYGYAKINTAFYDGEADKLPGGGPALAMKTVEQVIGVPIQYYAQIDFWAFSKFIDDIGKIEVDVPQKIIVDPVGPGDDEVLLSKGKHWLNGLKALAYVRNRHTANGDVDRSQRQQDVIMAIRNRVLDPQNFPYLVTGAPYLYNDIQAGVHTNMTFDEAMRLAMLVKDIPPEKIKRAVIDYTMVTLGSVTVKGENQSIVKPIPDKIRALRDEIFATGGAISPLAQGADALDLAKQEGASIIVLNGTFTQGLAIKTGDYLKGLGLNVLNNGNANENPPRTKVIIHSGRPYILKYLKELFHLDSSSQIIFKYDLAAPADIEVILGDDWALKNPMP